MVQSRVQGDPQILVDDGGRPGIDAMSGSIEERPRKRLRLSVDENRSGPTTQTTRFRRLTLVLCGRETTDIQDWERIVPYVSFPTWSLRCLLTN
jgi:hypothetical protein